MDNEIYSIMISPLTQSVNRVLAEILNKFWQYLLIMINNAVIKFPDQKPQDYKIKLIAGKIPLKSPFFPFNGKKIRNITVINKLYTFCKPYPKIFLPV